MDTDEARYSLATIRDKVTAGHALPNPSEVQWLLNELDWHQRHNKALDTENKRLTDALDESCRELKGAELELLDVSESLVRCRQDLELAKLELAELRQAATPAVSVA